ncbi:MAG TPA: hypothetical protein VHH35_16695, partial [Pyrinomonadaceae bacterium]|nr:hypothetical protein [Pyrinomonadaceae bacterium]
MSGLKNCKAAETTVLSFNHASRLFTSLIFIVVCRVVVSGGIPAPENMSTQQMTANTIRELKSNERTKESAPFYEALAKALKKRKIKVENIC